MTMSQVTSIHIAMASLLHLGVAAGVEAQESIIFDSVADLGQDGVSEELQGAAVVDSSDWPASFSAVIPVGVNEQGHPLTVRCTSTLVHPRALITAAHCVPDGGGISIRVKGEIFGGKCSHAPQYASDDSADYAMCLLSKDVVSPSVFFENINLDSSRVLMGGVLTLTGFGCTDIIDGKAVGADGKYRAGKVKITGLPGEAGNEKNTILTKGASDPNTALCMGDSGGAAFLIDESSGKRWMVSVNSRVRDSTKESFLSSTSSSDGKKFFEDQFAANGLKVCGVSSGAVRCRQ